MTTKLLLVAFLSLVWCCYGLTTTGEKKLAPSYVVNLDLPPEDRWKKVVQVYKSDINLILDKLIR
jgi:hypothetical protein